MVLMMGLSTYELSFHHLDIPEICILFLHSCQMNGVGKNYEIVLTVTFDKFKQTCLSVSDDER